MLKKSEKSKGLHIGFSGIDGAGKSTQMCLLETWLKKDAHRNVMRFELTTNFTREVTNALARKMGVYSGRNPGKHYFGVNNYSMIQSAEVLQQVAFVHSHTNIGYYVVSSRSISDWIASVRVRGCNKKTRELTEGLMLMRGTPDLMIWLDTSPEVALERLLSRGIDVEKLGFLQRFRAEFERLNSELTFRRIDGDGDISSVQQDIISLVEGYL